MNSSSIEHLKSMETQGREATDTEEIISQLSMTTSTVTASLVISYRPSANPLKMKAGVVSCNWEIDTRW